MNVNTLTCHTNIFLCYFSAYSILRISINLVRAFCTTFFSATHLFESDSPNSYTTRVVLESDGIPGLQLRDIFPRLVESQDSHFKTPFLARESSYPTLFTRHYIKRRVRCQEFFFPSQKRSFLARREQSALENPGCRTGPQRCVV